MNPNSKNFDILVIGGGISGLTIATAMGEKHKVALVEKESQPGGLCLVGRHEELGGANFHSIPFRENDEAAFDIIEDLTNQSLEKEAVSSAPVFFDDGIKPFLGFGEDQPQYIDEIEFYTEAKRWKFKNSPGDWTQKLFKNFKGDFFGDSEVTSLIVEDKQVLGVVINGRQKIYFGRRIL